MKELIFLKELISVSQINQKSDICHYWYFKDIGFKDESHVCNKCHDLLMVVYDLKNVMILNIKDVDYRCHVFNMSGSDAINLLNNSWLNNKGVL